MSGAVSEAAAVVTFHSADVAIGAVLIFLVWVIGLALAPDPALEQQHIAPAHYCVDPPVTAAAVPTTDRHVVASSILRAPAAAVTHCK